MREIFWVVSRRRWQAQKRFYGRGPTKAKSYLLDNFLLVVMRGGILQAERTMVERGREELVRSFRQQFEDEMSGRLITLVEELTERRVANYQSQIVFDPDMVFEIFVFDDVADEAVAGGDAPGR